MTKRYATTYSTGYTEQSSSPYEARSFHYYDEEQTFALSGKPVTAADFYAAVDAAIEAAFHKKNTTHKLISVQHGVTPFARVTKWVRRSEPAALADLAALDAALARDHAAHQRAERAPDVSFAQAMVAVGEALL